ncbi:MAG: DUF3368 domain-containing protein [Bacteroidia bacterium]
MNNKIVISDASPIFSLAVINKLDILNLIFGEVYIPEAVWDEITFDKTSSLYNRISAFFEQKKKKIEGVNNLVFVMDYGESEAVLLFKEMGADYLLIDDRKARNIAESLGVNCIGTLGVLSIACERGFIKELRPLFEQFIYNKRYYSKTLLNAILHKHEELPI